MKEPRPLTKERREQIEKWLTPSSGGFRRYEEAQFIRELVAAEAYWREAVKNCQPQKYLGFECVFCGQWDNAVVATHKPGCPWGLAQD